MPIRTAQQNTYAHATTVTNALSQSQKWIYDYGSGKPVSATDASGAVTGYAYNDPLDRLTATTQANGGTVTYAYTSPTQMDTCQDQVAVNDQALHTQMIYDGLGRQTQANSFESSTGIIEREQSYDALGRVGATFNASRSGDGLNYETSYGYDALGRSTSVTNPDGTSKTTSYAGNVTTAKDEQGHERDLTAEG